MKLNVNQALAQAQKLALLGKTNEAIGLLRAVLQINPKNKIALKKLKQLQDNQPLPDADRAALMAKFNAGDAAGAISLAQELQKSYPNVGLLPTIQGAASAQLGDHKAAYLAFQRAVAIEPKSSQAFNNLGNSLKELGRLSDARVAFLRSIELNPKSHQSYNNLAVLLKDQKRYPQALRRFQQALTIDPDYHDARRNMGIVHQLMDDHDTAIETFKSCLSRQPNNIEAMASMAHSQRTKEQFDAAQKTLQTLLKLAPNRIEQRQQLGLIEVEMGHYQQAVETLKQVVKAQPNNIVSMIHLANAIGRTDDIDAALDVLNKVLDIDPNNLGALNNIGVMLQSKGDIDGAGAVYDRALALDGTLSELRMNRSVVHFLKAEFKEAWELYESRFDHENAATPLLKSTKPRWTGKNERLFVWAEQGLGDEVFFASLLSETRARVSKLIVSVDPRLKAMFERSFPDITFVSRLKTVSDDNFDSQIPIASLGGVIRNTLGSFDNQPTAYLAADQTRINDMRNSLGTFGGKTIGISWRTSNRKSNHVRNIDLTTFISGLNGDGVRFVNLQYGNTDAEVAKAIKETGAEIITLPDLDRFKDIEGLSAAICACDTIVTIDNSTVHLAAALGQETHLILPFFPDWRWSFVQGGSPWYPNLNIYRQGARFGWPRVLSNVSKALGLTK